MATNRRRELSRKNKYYIPKERRYELEHFCKQYPDWIKEYQELIYIHTPDYAKDKVSGGVSLNKVENSAIRLASIKHRIEIVKKAAFEADNELGNYILKAVTESKPYIWFQTNTDIPAGKDMFWDRERRFFWLLDKYRD